MSKLSATFAVWLCFFINMGKCHQQKQGQHVVSTSTYNRVHICFTVVTRKSGIPAGTYERILSEYTQSCARDGTRQKKRGSEAVARRNMWLVTQQEFQSYLTMLPSY